MKFWEFLLQKEGDYQWITISTSTLELEPGIYRIMANSDLIEHDIEVRMTHHTPTADNSSPTPQTYSRHTNKQGLVMIFPFTQLAAGTWEIRCCGDIMSELLGETWRKTLKIQVLEQANHQPSHPYSAVRRPSLRVTVGLEEDNSSLQEVVKNQSPVLHRKTTESAGDRWSVAAKNKDLSVSRRDQEINQINRSSINHAFDEKAQVYLEKLQQLIQQKVEPLLFNDTINFQQPTESFVKLSSPEDIVAPTLQLVLTQDNFYRKLGESINISGKIEVEDTDEELVLTARVCYQLKHPHNPDILLKVESLVSDEILPYAFNHTLVIPDELEEVSCLVGEVLLETITGVLITQYPFKIYSSEHHPVSYSIELFHTEHQESYKFDFEVTEKAETVTAPLELPTPPKLSYPLPSSISTSRQVLPPKLTPKSVPSDKKSLTLPKVTSH